MHVIFMVCQDAKENTNLTLLGVGSALLYFGLLRSYDVLNITYDDVTLNKLENKFEIQFENWNCLKRCLSKETVNYNC